MPDRYARKKMKVHRPSRGVMTIAEMFERSAHEFADTVLFRMRAADGKSWREYTYREGLEIVRKLAWMLVDRFGLQPGMHAAVIGENRPEWAFSYLAIQWAGGVVVPIDARLTPTEIRHILDHSESHLILAQEKYIPSLLDIQESVPTLKHVISQDPYPDVPDLWGLVKEAGSTLDRVPRNLDDLAVILYTSGTTGSSKGVMLTHRNIMSNVSDVYQCIPFQPGERVFSVLPIHHVFEGTAGFLTPIYGGLSITYSRSILRPREMRADMLDTRPHMFLVVPLLLEKIVMGIFREVKKAPAPRRAIFWTLWNLSRLSGRKLGKVLFRTVRAKLGLDELRYLVSGGAALPPWVAEALETMGFPLIQGYGLSETSPVLTANPPDAPRNESVGQALPSVEIRIVNPNEDGIGEIAARGPNIMKGYYKNPEATAEILDDEGWLYTGDMGYLDEDDYLYITGRKKYVIVSKGGKNIYPEEVENVLGQSIYIEEILCVGFKTPDGDEEIHVIVYPNYENLDAYFKEKGVANPRREDVEEVIRKELRHYSQELAPYKRPRTFSIREEEFEKTTTRKIKRFLYMQSPVPVEERRSL